MRSEAWLGVLLLAGCPRERGPLLDLATLEFVDAPDDPFGDRAANVDCPPSAYGIELTEPPSLEVDTGLCNYVTLTGPLLLDLGPQDILDLRIGHGVLSASEPAQAHVAVQIGDWLVYDRLEPIPNADRLLTELLVPPQAFDEGTPVWLHLHNHGANSWNFYLPSSLEPEGS